MSANDALLANIRLMMTEEITVNNDVLGKLVEDKLKPVLERIETLGLTVGEVEKKTLNDIFEQHGATSSVIWLKPVVKASWTLQIFFAGRTASIVGESRSTSLPIVSNASLSS